MRALALLASIVVSAGCAQMLGLDDTKIDYRDAALDAPGICDGTPDCTSLNGRSVCGRLIQTGAMAGIPLTASQPTGFKCTAAAMSGPCAFSIYAQPKAQFLANTGTGRVDGLIDDCGRFAVIDVDSSQPDVAVILEGDNTMFKRTASLLLGRTTLGGPGNVDKNVEVRVVTKTTAMDWATQVNGGAPPDTSTGYLITYLRQARPIDKKQVARNGGNALPKPPNATWAAYFSQAAAFGTLDGAATETSKAGTAFAVLGGGSILLEGVGNGSRCAVPDLVQVDNTLISVSVPGC